MFVSLVSGSITGIYEGCGKHEIWNANGSYSKKKQEYDILRPWVEQEPEVDKEAEPSEAEKLKETRFDRDEAYTDLYNKKVKPDRMDGKVKRDNSDVKLEKPREILLERLKEDFPSKDKSVGIYDYTNLLLDYLEEQDK